MSQAAGVIRGDRVRTPTRTRRRRRAVRVSDGGGHDYPDDRGGAMLAVLLSLAAAAMNAVASVAQRWATRDEPDRTGPLRRLFDLIRRPAWWAGIGAMISGFSLGACALALVGPTSFFLLQYALQAGSLAASQPGFTLINPLTAVLWGCWFSVSRSTAAPDNSSSPPRSSPRRRCCYCGSRTSPAPPPATTPMATGRRTTTQRRARLRPRPTPHRRCAPPRREGPVPFSPPPCPQRTPYGPCSEPWCPSPS